VKQWSIRPSVRLSVTSIDSSSGVGRQASLLLNAHWAEISIDSLGRWRRVPTAGAPCSRRRRRAANAGSVTLTADVRG